MTDQTDLFGGTLAATPSSKYGRARRQATPDREWKPPGGSPARAGEVLAEVQEGRFGVLDGTDRVVQFEDDRHVRHTPDEDVVVALITGGYVREGGPRDVVGCRHGAVIRPVSPLTLTPTGKNLLHRWSAYKPLDGGA